MLELKGTLKMKQLKERSKQTMDMPKIIQLVSSSHRSRIISPNSTSEILTMCFNKVKELILIYEGLIEKLDVLPSS